MKITLSNTSSSQSVDHTHKLGTTQSVDHVNCCTSTTNSPTLFDWYSIWDPYYYYPYTYMKPATYFTTSTVTLHPTSLFSMVVEGNKCIIELRSMNWNKEHLSITYEQGNALVNGKLTIKGECKTAYNAGGISQSFSATHSLPTNIDYTKEPECSLKDNKLTITFSIQTGTGKETCAEKKSIKIR